MPVLTSRQPRLASRPTQWCFPLLRQHTGRLESVPDAAAKSGAAKGSHRAASTRMERSRRNDLIETPKERVCKRHVRTAPPKIKTVAKR